MYSLALAVAALGVAIEPALGVSWVMGNSMAIAMSRVDPIVDPGNISGHVHNILGGSKFSKDPNNPGDLLDSKCSSVDVQADKSNYWAPQLFYRFKDNTLSPMLGSSRIYYFNNGPDVKPFPKGLKMISGTTMYRNASDPKNLGVLLSCNHGEQTKFLPNKKDNAGGCSSVSLGIFFPSCGLADGSIDSEDHFSHMAWPHDFNGTIPVDVPNGHFCPDSHPVQYPVIFMEHNYWFSDAQPWRNEDDLLVLSNGDTTGLAYHADFHNGWDENVLTQAIKQCSVGDQLQNCPPFKDVVDIQKAWDCRLEGEIPAEEVGLLNALPSLPGCNPLWTASMDNSKKPTCDAKDATPGFVAPNSFFRNDKQRMNIPLTLPNATQNLLTSWYRPDVYQGLNPVVGNSNIQVWGSEDYAKYVKVSTVNDVLKNFVEPNGRKAVPNGASSASSSAAAGPTAINAVVDTGNQATSGNNVHLADGSSVSSAVPSSPAAASKSSGTSATVTITQAAATVTVTDKTCRRRSQKKRLVRKAGDAGEAIRSHLSRRSRRQAVQG